MNKKLLQCLVLFLGTLATKAGHAQNLRLNPESLTFVYQDYSGETRFRCQQRLENELSQDWIVECHNEIGEVKKAYRVHLWVTRYERKVQPKVSFEILYWLTDLLKMSVAKTSTGSTTWVNLKEPSDLHSLSLSQSVDLDTAGLYLDIVL
jgi:hypothetical protein